jgi:hypothetical protein
LKGLGKANGLKRVISNYPGAQAPSWLVAASTARARWRS